MYLFHLNEINHFGSNEMKRIGFCCFALPPTEEQLNSTRALVFFASFENEKNKFQFFFCLWLALCSANTTAIVAVVVRMCNFGDTRIVKCFLFSLSSSDFAESRAFDDESCATVPMHTFSNKLFRSI